jgi:hypothetical protein
MPSSSPGIPHTGLPGRQHLVDVQSEAILQFRDRDVAVEQPAAVIALHAQDIEGSRGWFTNDGLDQILQRDDALQQVSDRDALAGPVCGDPGEYLGQAGPAVGRLESWPGSPRFIDATGAAAQASVVVRT